MALMVKRCSWLHGTRGHTALTATWCSWSHGVYGQMLLMITCSSQSHDTHGHVAPTVTDKHTDRNAGSGSECSDGKQIAIPEKHGTACNTGKSYFSEVRLLRLVKTNAWHHRQGREQQTTGMSEAHATMCWIALQHAKGSISCCITLNAQQIVLLTWVGLLANSEHQGSRQTVHEQ